MKRIARVVLVASVIFVGRVALASEPLVIDHHDPLLRLLMAHPQQRYAVAAEIVANPQLIATEEIEARTSVSPMKHLFRAAKGGQAALEFVLRKRRSEVIPPVPRGAGAPPNVVLLAIDGLPMEPLVAATAEDVAPRMVRLAGEGVWFASAYAPSAFSLPAFASMFTGVTPERHGLAAGAQRGKVRLEHALPTLAGVVAANAMDTAGFFTHPTLDGIWGLGRGFDLYQGLRDGRAVSVVAHARMWLDWHAFHVARGLEPEAYLLFLQFRDLRDPLGAPAPYQKLFPDDAVAAALRYVDDQIGILIDTLAGAGSLDDTVVVVVGGPTGPPDGSGDAPTRVPLVIRYPRGAAASQRVEAEVATTQLLTTVAAWIGAESPGGPPLPIAAP